MATDDVRRLLIYLTILIGVSVLQYSCSFTNGFVWDAELAFTEDPTIRSLEYLPLSFQEPTFEHFPGEGERLVLLDYYRPLIKVLHIFEYQWFGENPIGYKAVNVILNAGVVSLFFVFVLSATQNRVGAFVAALLYAVNPTRAEAVYWAYSDSYVLVGLFTLLALVLYQQRHLVAALGALALALMCHEMAILLPVIVLLYMFLVEEKRVWRAYLPAVAFIAVAAAYLMLRTAVVGSVPLVGVDLVTYLNTAAVVLQRYAKIFVVPDALVTIYPSQLFPRATIEVVVSHFVIVLFFALGVVIWSKRRSYLFWYLWFFIWIALSLNIGEFGSYLMAEKLLYLGSAGFCVLLGLLAGEIQRKRFAAYMLIGGLAIFHSAIVFARAPYWKGTIAYLEKGLEFAPDFYLGHYDLGNAYSKAEEFDKALDQFDRAVKINPGFSLAHNNMGNIYYLRGDIDDAVAAWESAIAGDPTNPMPYFNIGLVLKNRGDLAGARWYFDKYLSIERKGS